MRWFVAVISVLSCLLLPTVQADTNGVSSPLSPVQPVIIPGASGTSVSNLQQALIYLYNHGVFHTYDPPNRPTADELSALVATLNIEAGTSSFGDATRQMVLYFQIQQGLGDHLHGVVESTTAERLNQILIAIDPNIFTPEPINGICGPAHGSLMETAPTTNLCILGTASVVSPFVPKCNSGWSWTCLGENGGTDSPICQAFRIPPPSNQLALPTIQRIVSRRNALVIYFDAQSTNDIDYTAVCNQGTTFHETSGLSSPLTVSPLTNGVNYSCMVVATNCNGDSVNSTSISKVVGKVGGVVPLIGIILND